MYPPRYMHISAFGKNAGHMHAGRVSEALVPAVLRLPSHQLHEVGCPHAHFTGGATRMHRTRSMPVWGSQLLGRSGT